MLQIRRRADRLALRAIARRLAGDGPCPVDVHFRLLSVWLRADQL